MSTSIPPEALHERITQPGRDPRGMPPVSVQATRPARPLVALGIGAAIARKQLLGRAGARIAVLAVALAVSGASIERWVARPGAVDRALDGTFQLIVPFVALFVMAEASGRMNLRDMAWRAARFGVARRDVALGVLGAAMVAAAGLSTLAAVVSVLVASSSATGPIGADVASSAGIAVVTAAAYVGWFGLGSTFLRRGGGRWVALLVDFVVGGSSGIAGALLPRANARNLLGGAAPLGLTQPASMGALVCIAVVFGALAAIRCRE